MKFSGSALGLQPYALTAITLTGLYTAAESLCSAFVGVYLYLSANDITPVLKHYLALYGSVPVTFVLAGWYVQSRDKMHAYRLGLLLHVVYYAFLLHLRERAPDYAVPLGLLIGSTWGIFYAGANTMHFDVSSNGRRGAYLGFLTSVNGFFQLTAPLISGTIIYYVASERLAGYQAVFGGAIGLYCACFLISFHLPREGMARPFKLRTAIFPPPTKRDWRIAMTTGVAQLGIDVVVMVLMPLLMFMETRNEMSVGGFTSFQALAGVIVAWIVGRTLNSRSRTRYMVIGAGLTLLASIILTSNVTVATLIVFGFLRAIGEPMFAIPQTTVRWDIISNSIEAPYERVAYLCAFEVCLGVGRVAAIAPLVLFAGHVETTYSLLVGTILVLAIARLVCLAMLARTQEMRTVA